MKKLSSLIIISAIAFLFLIMQNVFSQSYNYAEFLIVNNTGNNDGFPIIIDVYPVGAIFNGDNAGGYTGQYTPIAAHPIDPNNNNKIFGVHSVLPPF